MPRYSHHGLRGWLIAFTLLLAPNLAAQQNATVQGTIADESQGVLPGATVTATEISNGVQTVAITAADGRYEFENLPPGRYKLRIELSGFATTEITETELLVGQHATVPRVMMKVATVAETVTVTGQAPLVDVTSSQVAANIDRRQMAELPLQGRNWEELALMVKGITANSIVNTPGVNDDQYQLNLDGQQITQRVAGSGFGEPKLSREAIAEFQVQTNLYDITEGRSTGIQVQAISRSGTNDMHGSTFGFFRSDAFNAADPVKGTVLPYSDQQAGGTLGGPIIRDKVHFFGSYEYERNPLTAVLTPSALPGQSFLLPSNTVQGNYLGKIDYQQSAVNSYTVRFQRWTSNNPQAITSGTSDPNAAESDRFYSTNSVRHLDACRHQQPADAGAPRDRPVFLVQRSAGVEQRAVLQRAVRGPGVSISQPDPRRTTERAQLHLADRVLQPAGSELAQGATRDEIRRRIPGGHGHESLGSEPPRHLRVQQAAVDGHAGGRLPGGDLEQSQRLEHQQPPALSAGVQTSSSTRTTIS